MLILIHRDLKHRVRKCLKHGSRYFDSFLFRHTYLKHRRWAVGQTSNVIEKQTKVQGLGSKFCGLTTTLLPLLFLRKRKYFGSFDRHRNSVLAVC